MVEGMISIKDVRMIIDNLDVESVMKVDLEGLYDAINRLQTIISEEI